MYYNRTYAINFIVCFLFATTISWSQTINVAPTLTATGNQAYCPKSVMNIVTDFDIVDPDDSGTKALYIQISTGYVSGEDKLLLAGTYPNILTSWSSLEGKFTLKGIASANVSYVELIAAVKDVTFQSSSNSPTDKTFSITIGDANYLPSTGHYYQYIPSLGITWTAAKALAEASNYYGLQGYLATLSSAEEAKLCGEQAAGAGWIGGSDAAVEGDWKWVTGPEAGTSFWSGLYNGYAPNGEFSFWNVGEPNNVDGGEDYAHITFNSGTPGTWNDLPNIGGTGNYSPKGYIVEYGGFPGETPPDISTSSKIYTTAIETTKPASVCGSGVMILEATPKSTILAADILWFDAPTGGFPKLTSPTFTTPNLTTTTIYYVLASLNGCTEGLRVPVTATVYQIPTITSVTDDLVCDSGKATLSATASAGIINWYDAPVNGNLLISGSSFKPVVNATTNYYVDATNNGCTTVTRTQVTATVQKTPVPTANTPQRFCDIAKATVADLTVTGTNILWYASNTGGTPLNSADLLTSNTTYYASQTLNTCESINRVAVTILIDETVIAPPTIPVLNACDTKVDGDDTNGFTTFDLTANETFLLNGKLAANYSIAYFLDAGYSNPIATPSNAFINTVQDEQTIYVRITNATNNTCFTDAFFEIQVNALPVIKPLTVFKNCDEDGIADGFTNFNLEEVNDIIANNNASTFNFSYYLSSSDANAGGTNAINTIFNNQTASTIYVRVENTSGCYRVATVNLEVSTTTFPPNTFVELENCDDDAIIDGRFAFDLTQASTTFISKFPTGQNLSVHYYKNLDDALLEQNEITTPTNYTNETPFSETLFVRVESEDNGECFGIGPYLQLTVHPRPEFEVDNSAIYCLDNNPITLVTFNPKGNYSYSWKDETGLEISDFPYAEVISGGSYTVVATSTDMCESFPIMFNVVESAIATIGLEDITIVELSDNNTITINNENNNLGIGDYEFALDGIGGPYQDEPFFINVGAGSHTIYVKDKNLCGIAQLDVFILGFPKFFTPNNDGFNDTWQVKGLDADYSNASIVTIYDRYGKLIKQINAKTGVWDGTFNGLTLGSSDYWFVAQLIEVAGTIKTYKGHFSLVQ